MRMSVETVGDNKMTGFHQQKGKLYAATTDPTALVDKETGEVAENNNELVYALCDAIDAGIDTIRLDVRGLYNLPLTSQRVAELVADLGAINKKVQKLAAAEVAK